MKMHLAPRPAIHCTVRKAQAAVSASHKIGRTGTEPAQGSVPRDRTAREEPVEERLTWPDGSRLRVPGYLPVVRPNRGPILFCRFCGRSTQRIEQLGVFEAGCPRHRIGNGRGNIAGPSFSDGSRAPCDNPDRASIAPRRRYCLQQFEHCGGVFECGLCDIRAGFASRSSGVETDSVPRAAAASG